MALPEMTNFDILELQHLANKAKQENHNLCNPVLTPDKLLELCAAWDRVKNGPQK
jgi:hypothetical protein